MADMHHVVEIKYAGSKDKETFQKANRAKCKIHILQDYCIFCQTCDEHVCPSCLTKSHQKHDLQEIDEVYTEDINSLKSCQTELNNKFLDIYEKQISNIETTKVNNIDHFKMVKSKVEKQESKMISAVNFFKQNILEDLEEKSCEIESVVSSAKPTIQKNIEEVRDKLDVIANVVNTKDIENVHKSAKNVRKWISSTSEPVTIHPTVFNKLPDFFPESIDKNAIGTLFGKLSIKNETLISVIEVYTSNTPSIDRVTVHKGNELWISSVTTKVLRRVRTNPSCTVNFF
ncbi:uncharacterized protein DDB_G0279899-like [Mytilus trossulus]|uniref:uncharacterized protein DDB_G0279899-like n=1 Tax=Mytilus trossulus TaxID=6551 RepID=UPI003004780F